MASRSLKPGVARPDAEWLPTVPIRFTGEVLPDVLLRELGDHASLPFDQARMLPLEVYRSPEVLAAELDNIFGADWLCVGRTADVAEPGDWFSASLPNRSAGDDGDTSTGRSVLVVRGRDDEIRAFDNVCIHRGVTLLEGCGSVNRITCPYHAWTYGLDGRLLGGPYMNRSTEADGTPFDPARHTLGRLPVAVWEGFVFVSQADNPPPIADNLGGLTDVVGRYRMADYVPIFSTVDVWPTNWKLLVENFMDAYHVFKVHKNSFGVDGDNTRFTTMYPGTESWAHHLVHNPADPDF
ncbi:MAG: aromatic ring-hydroxylating dioxygenase subunit alpha, partial [Actinomycetota bacterium]